MNYKVGILAGSVLMLFTFGCEPEKPKNSVVIRPANSVNELFGNRVQAPVAPVSATPTTSTSTSATTLPTNTSPASAGGATGLNPAHGQPGHRCEIPVGAPLNSAPQTKPATITQQPSPAQPTITTAPAGGSVAAGTNPQHGQPGHDCSIAVGAPLKK